YRPEPWTVVDAFLIEYFVGFALAMESLEPKLFLARALGQLGFERGSWLYPRPLPPAAADAERLAAYRGLEPAFFEALTALAPPPAGGSNAWPLAVREETIAVRGDEPVRLVVRATRNGPLLDAVAAVTGAAAGVPVALRWKPAIAPGHSAAGWLAVNRSRGLDDVLAAATAFDGAPFESNLVYGDADGHLAHLPLGAVPRRRGELGMLPALGWRG